MDPTRVSARVDHDVCVGNAMCRAVAPVVFVEGSGGQSVAVNAAAESPETILEAAANCPWARSS